MRKLLFLSGFVLALTACDGSPPSYSGPHADADGNLRYGDVRFKPCALDGSALSSVEAHCGRLNVPENHDAPNGRQIELAIALVPATGQAEADPMLFIAGGPGQSAIDSFPMVRDAFADALRNRHVLLVDARGTGSSHPLKCIDSKGENAFGEGLDDSPAAARAFAERCRDRLSKDSDLRRYATGDHIRDLDLVRRALGVDRLNLVGVSYGTRVAQQFAKRYPQHTRTVTLDSIAPNTLVLGQEHARNLDAALKQQFARCNADSACKRNLGDPAELLARVRTRLQAGPVPAVRFRDPVGGEWKEETPSFGHLAMLLRLYAYQPQAAAMLPVILHDADQGHYESLLAQAEIMSSDLSGSMMHGMGLSVGCTEDPELKSDPADADTVMGNEFADYILAQCAVWPKGERDPDFRKPLRGEVPVLAISGEYDPVTPPRYGDEVVKSLPNGRHLVLPGQGHSVLGIGCMPKLFAQFIESADAKSLDAACLKRLQPAAPFAGNYGWEP